MFSFEETLKAMRGQRAWMQQELNRLDRAISALQAVMGDSAPARSAPKPSVRSVPQTAKKRLTEGKQMKGMQQGKRSKPRPKISAQGLRNIIEAQKKRW